ncbi:MAG TPA: MarR family transcriptional regulator [Anaerolineales bacterium]|nr:MarR family transcriptional regulator [Anaerolineales bacterium]
MRPAPTVDDRLMGLMSRLEKLGLGRPRLAKVGLSLPQFGMLGCVWREPGIRVHQVAEKLGVTMPTVSVAVRKLEEGGWLQRKPDAQDKRSIRLYLSRKASLLARRMGAQRRRTISEFMNALSEREQDQLLNLLEKAITNLENKSQPRSRRA